MTIKIPTLHAVESSNISHVGHCADSNCLYIRFNSGLYRHEGVPADLHQQLMDAESKGKFYHQNIKGKFPATKVE